MSPHARLRRQLVLGSSALLLATPITAAQRALTPSQMLGPFYPVTPPLHKDNDLTQVEGRSARAAGQIADLSGRVLDIDGRPLAGLRVAVVLAPGRDTVSTTVGWMQQFSALGQFIGPPVVAWVATLTGGWQWTWTVTGASSLLGLMLASRLQAAWRARP